MKKLFIFYDASCPFCRWCREWVSAQPKYLAVEFHPHGDPAVQAAFPDLAGQAPEENLVVFSDTGLVYLGDQAWIMILWALRDWRAWSLRLGEPAMRPLARRFWGLLHQHRGKLGWFLRAPTGRAAEQLAGDPPQVGDLCSLEPEMETPHG